MVKAALLGTVLAAVWLAPAASADPRDEPFLSYLAAHHVVVDRTTALDAAHVACAQIASGVATSTVENTLLARFPTTINGAEYWIVAASKKIYCPR